MSPVAQKDQLTTRSTEILNWLQDNPGGRTAQEIAKGIGVTPMGVTAALRSLERAKLVSVHPDNRGVRHYNRARGGRRS